MILYHGSNIEFDVIDLTKSKPNKDFGRGFYLSPTYMQAMEMAKIKVEQMKTGSPKVMEYQFDENYDGLNILRFDNYSEQWAKFILLNRNNVSPNAAHNYDIVIGPIADDRVGVQLWKYESHIIDLPTLVENLRYIKGITIQYFFGTYKAISKLTRI